MNMWYESLSSLEKVLSKEKDLTVDQQLKVAEIQALLAIGQDLNGLRLKDTEPFS